MKRLLTILFFLPLFVSAQISVSRPVAGSASTTNASSYAWGASFTPTANSFLVVFVYSTGSVTASPTMTGGSLTWTLQSSAINAASSGNSIYCFTAPVGASPSSTTITFDCTGDASTGVLMSLAQFTGQSTSGTIAQVKINTSSTTSTNANFSFNSSVSTNNGYFIGWVDASPSANVSTAPSNWTEADDIAISSPNANIATAYRSGGETTSGAFTFTNGSATWLSFGIEVNVAGAVTYKQGFMF